MGFLFGLWNASRRARHEGIAAEKVLDLGPWLILGTIIGARILYVVGHWEQEFANRPIWEIFMVQKGGLVFYGGLIGASLMTLGYMLKKKLPVWKFGDVLAPSIALGYFFGRFGCLMNGCCYGRPTNVPWAITFPEVEEIKGIPVHPTQIYESLLSLALYAALAWLYRRKRFDGQIFATYLMCYAVLRSFVEIFRGDYPTYYFGGYVTPAHLISVGIFATGLILFFVLPRRGAMPKPA
jgi:phosphatidylglycerol:prolipoprotein diacylglycerol transferase